MKTQMDIFGGTCAVRSFEDDAMGFLLAYVKRSRGQPFCAEDVTMAMIAAGIAPQDLRAVGPVFNQAAKDGLIRRSLVPFRRAFGNGSLTLGWEAV